MKKFEPGKTYTFTFIGDSDSCVPCKVISRTEKTVTIQVRNDEPVRKKVHLALPCGDHTAYEYCYPTGIYSMAPMLGADREKIIMKDTPEKIYLDPKTSGNIVGGYNGNYRDKRQYDRDVEYTKTEPLNKLLREMRNNDMAGGYWYNELHRILEEGK